MNTQILKRYFYVLVTLFSVLLSVSAHAERTVTYYHTDVLGSIVAATDEGGDVVWRKTYDPYGNEVTERPDGEEVEHQAYTGKPYDDETGLVYLNQRYYDPQIRRFMGIDPVGFTPSSPTSFNRYAYANNNPYKYTDPDGRFPFLIPVVIFIAKEVAAEAASQATGGLSDYLSFRKLGQKALKKGALELKNFRKINNDGTLATKGGDLVLHRRGAVDSSKLLKNQAAAAEKHLKEKVHGVSVSTSSKPGKPGQVVRCATCNEIEQAGFKVHKTGNDPNHFTVELPKPVTKEVSKKFNEVFK